MTEKENNELRETPPRALSIPAQSPPPRDSFLLSVKGVRRWAEELPVANIGETARQVYNTLVTFNRIQIPTRARTEIIEIFREPVRHVITNINRHYYNAGFPLPSKATKAAQLANALCSEAANGYKILFLDQILGDEKRFNQKLAIVAAQRAIQYLGQKMFHNLLVYRDYPEGLWREANYLYAWAYQNQVVDVPVRESSGYPWNRKNSKSIDEVYKAMALMATTNPYRLRHSQMRRLHTKMPHWAQLAVIRPAHESSGDTGIFYINLRADAPPSRSLNARQRKGSRILVLDLNPVLEEARAEFEAAEWETPAHLEKDHKPLSRTLLRPLIRHWSKGLQHRFPRAETRHEIEAIVGLSNLLRLLSEEREQEETEERTQTLTLAQTQSSARMRSPASPSSRLTWNDSIFASLAINSPAKPAGGDSIFPDDTAVISTLIGTMDEESEKNRGDLFHYNKRRADTLFTVLSYNESVAGYCIDRQKNLSMGVRVGDVLGVRSAQNPDELGVTVVRWLRQPRGQELFLGLQVLSSRCAEVMITPSSKPGSNRQNQYRCLLLTDADLSGEKRSLLTNTQVFKLNTVLTMSTEFGQHRIKLTRWIESNNNFIHYELEYVDPGELAEQGHEDETVGFEDLWNEL